MGSEFRDRDQQSTQPNKRDDSFKETTRATVPDHPLFHLQHTIGNHGVLQLLKSGRLSVTQINTNSVAVASDARRNDKNKTKEHDSLLPARNAALKGQASSARQIAAQAYMQTSIGQRSVHDHISDLGTAGHVSPSRSMAGSSIATRGKIVNKAGNNIIQRLPNTFYGEFKTTKYDTVTRDDGDEIGVDIQLEFHPDKSKVDAEKIGLTQSIHYYMGGTSVAIHPTQHDRMVPSTASHGAGSQIDRLANRENPLYGADNPPAGSGLEGTPPLAGARQLGWHYFDVAGKEHTQEAILTDRPVLRGRDKDAGQVFETAALAVEGAQEGTYMGSVSWGWTTDSTGAFTKEPLTLVSEDVPSEGFMAAATKWNQATTLGTIKTTADPTSVYDHTYSVAFTVARDTEVEVTSLGGFSYNDEEYSPVKILSAGTHHHKTGRIKVNDLADQGDGDATIDLPIQWVGTVTVEPHLGSLGTLREGRGTHTNVLADLPVGTRVKVMDDSNAWLRVEVDTAQAGVILNRRSRARRDRAGMLRGYISRELVQR